MSISIYNPQKNGWVDDNGNVLVEGDNTLVGGTPEAWMNSIALVEIGECGAMTAIKEVIYHIYNKEFQGTPFIQHPVILLPRELLSRAKQQVSGEGMEDAKAVFELFEMTYNNTLDRCEGMDAAISAGKVKTFGFGDSSHNIDEG